MGFTPASGLVMGTRTGDIDSGLVAYLARIENLTTSQFDFIANHASGMLGVSGTSGDMRVLLEREGSDPAAAEAVMLFCYSARKWIGAFTAVLEGLDTLVFSGGIGENAAAVRERICTPLHYLGVEIDAAANAAHAAVISTAASRVEVRVMRTDEELMIARCVARMAPGGAGGVTGA
jgi:acetate kinase